MSLAAGRSQREKKRSYKDLLREEEEIAEQVRKSSKKRSKVRFVFPCTVSCLNICNKLIFKKVSRQMRQFFLTVVDTASVGTRDGLCFKGTV